MKNKLSLLLLTLSLSLFSCSDLMTPPTLEQAWLGEGEFSTRAGNKAVKAQLELLSDGSYRYLILEPRILMLTGMESGSWTRQGQQLTLQPVNEKHDPTKEDPSVFAQLRKGSPENLRVKTLHIAEDLSTLQLSDGPLDMKFSPNPKATQKLKQSGEIN